MCRCVATITGHDAAVSSVVPAGSYLYTASHGSEIRVWGQPDFLQCDRFGFSTDQGSVKAILVAGDRIFCAHQDHKIRVWSRGRRSSASKEPMGRGAHKPVATLPTKRDCFICSLSQKNYVQVRRHHKKLWIQHADTISALAIEKRNKLLYSGSWDKTVKVWRLSDLRCVESIRAHNDALNALVVSEEGFLYTASADGKVKVWRKEPNVKRHSLVATLEGHRSAVNALALSGDGELLFSGGSDGAISVWGKGKGEQHISVLRSTLQSCHRLPILCLCTTTKAGDLLLSGSADKSVRAWRISTGDCREYLSCVAVLKGHCGPVKSISVAANDQLVVNGGCLVYSGSADKSIKVWWVSTI